jgi:rhodanese-related sulfurtransferase
LIDVRPPVQFGIVNTNQSSKLKDKIKAVNIQMRDLDKNKELFTGHEKVFIMCRKGNSSKEATELILKQSE